MGFLDFPQEGSTAFGKQGIFSYNSYNIVMLVTKHRLRSIE